jgi:hypothetical protein
MKQLFLSISFVLFLFLLTEKSIAQDFENPGTYMSFISKQHQTIAKRYLAYNSASSHGKKAKKVEGLKSKLLDEIQESRMNISGMPSFKNDKSLRDSAVSFMKLYYNALNEDYSKIVNMEEISEQSYDLMEAYMLAKEMVDKKMDDASAALDVVVKQFAAAHNVNLVDSHDDIDDMMKQVGETYDYYNPVYLIFFKSYKQESYLVDAVEKKNINAIEQNRNTLIQYSQAGLEKLAKLSAFKGDNSIATKCKLLLQFYVKEATEKIPAITDYLMKQEAFGKMQKEFEKKLEPGKDEVNAYNNAVKEVNNGVKTFNNNSHLLFETRGQLLDNWNSAVDEFFDNHMPTYN